MGYILTSHSDKLYGNSYKLPSFLFPKLSCIKALPCRTCKHYQITIQNENITDKWFKSCSLSLLAGIGRLHNNWYITRALIGREPRVITVHTHR